MVAGVLKALISQNTDGLHRRSGVDPSKLFELHGNSNLERCRTCGKEYLRDYRTRNSTKGVHHHATGRLCAKGSCRGKLYDTIINFGEDLPARIIDGAFEESKAADLCLVLGSSLTVTPAADVPAGVARRGRLVIVNLQATPLDSTAALVIHGAWSLQCRVVTLPYTHRTRARNTFPPRVSDRRRWWLLVQESVMMLCGS
jgi:NAD-dependent SIR2 family protein deacetylase